MSSVFTGDGWPNKLLLFDRLATSAMQGQRQRQAPLLGVDTFDKSTDTILPQCVHHVIPIHLQTMYTFAYITLYCLHTCTLVRTVISFSSVVYAIKF